MSHVTVASEVVLSVCQERLDRIRLHRNQVMANCIYVAAHRQYKHWFKPPTTLGYQGAFELLENESDYGDDYYYASHGYLFEDEQKACIALIRLAKIGNPVTITDNHAALFKRYIEDNEK